MKFASIVAWGGSRVQSQLGLTPNYAGAAHHSGSCIDVLENVHGIVSTAPRTRRATGGWPTATRHFARASPASRSGVSTLIDYAA